MRYWEYWRDTGGTGEILGVLARYWGYSSEILGLVAVFVLGGTLDAAAVTCGSMLQRFHLCWIFFGLLFPRQLASNCAYPRYEALSAVGVSRKKQSMPRFISPWFEVR